jgi:hypothetical protein
VSGLRWTIEQVVALAGNASRFGAGEATAVPGSWTHSGAGERALWGRFHGSGREPYDIAVDHERVAHRCTCPSRVQPCKHVLGLLVLWVRGMVADGSEPTEVARWIERERRRGDEPAPIGRRSDVVDDAPGPQPANDATGPAGAESSEPPPTESTRGDRDGERNERVARLVGGLVELDRWLEDRVRTGLADPSVARYETWDDLAARLVDARAGALANRVRRLAGRVGTSPDWPDLLLADLGVLYLIAQAGQRVPSLPPDLADGIAVACGWQVRRADVEASPPETDRWLVLGRSDVREDLVEVRRVWLRGLDRGRTALVLSFAAYRQSLDASLPVGTVVDADVHRYPGSGHRAIVGLRRGEPTRVDPAHVTAGTLADAMDGIGRTIAAEPWVERVPAVVRAAPTVADDGGWALTDHTGSLPIAADASDDAVAVLLAASAGRPLVLAIEWSTVGIVPLAAYLTDRTLDIGPRADPSFVSAA